MVCGNISAHHLILLYVVGGNLTGICYMNELIWSLVLPGLQQIGGGAVL